MSFTPVADLIFVCAFCVYDYVLIAHLIVDVFLSFITIAYLIFVCCLLICLAIVNDLSRIALLVPIRELHLLIVVTELRLVVAAVSSSTRSVCDDY